MPDNRRHGPSEPTPDCGAPRLSPADRFSYLPEPDPTLRWDNTRKEQPMSEPTQDRSYAGNYNTVVQPAPQPTPAPQPEQK